MGRYGRVALSIYPASLILVEFLLWQGLESSHEGYFLESLKAGCIIASGCRNKLPNISCFQTTEMYSLPVVEIKNPESRCEQGHVPSGGSRGECFFQPLMVPGIPWFVAASLFISALSSDVFLFALCYCPLGLL